MNELDNIIRDYLKATDTDYAIMINGDWGSGKSYYIRHGFQKVVTSERCDVEQNIWAKIHAGTTKSVEWVKTKFEGENKESEEPKYDENRYYPFYVSLYGVSSVADFNSRVADGVHDWTVKGWQVVTTVADSKYNINLPFSPSAYVPHNAVLVFDDLERICTDRISAVEVLGLINSFAEHYKKKVVIVCNENEFAKKASKEGQTDEESAEFSKYKEKTIRFVYTYVPDVPVVYDVFAQQYQGAYGEYLRREKHYILGLFSKGGKQNLRTLRFFVDIFEKIYTIAEAIIQDKYKDTIFKKLLVSTLIYVMEYKQGVSKEDLLQLQLQITTNTEEWLEQMSAMAGNPAAIDKKTNAYNVAAVHEKYGVYFEEMVRARWMVDYIMTGALRKENIKIFADEQRGIEMRKEGSPAVQALLKLKDYTHIEDVDLFETIGKIRDYISQDQYTMFELLDVYSTLAKYTIHKVKGATLKKTDDKFFRDALDRITLHHRYEPIFERKAVEWDRSTLGIEEVKRYYKIRDYAKAINERASSQEYEETINNFLSIVEKGEDIQAIEAYRDKDRSQRLSLRGMDWDRLYNALMMVSNPMANAVIVCVESLLVNDYSSWSKSEYEVLELFRDKLNAQVEKEGRIRVIYLRELVYTITDYLRKNYRK